MSEQVCNICKNINTGEFVENNNCNCNTLVHKNCLFNELIYFNKCKKCKSEYTKHDGVYITCYKNGKVMDEVYFVDGKKHGTFKCYFSDGVLHTYTEYVKDKKHGKEIWFNSSGKIVDEKEFKNGLLDGEYKYYYLNGNVKFIEGYRKNKLIYSKNFNEDGVESF
jgi:antitoxin component YwqK of YwqJK toxin-antitoxin module